MGIQTGYSTSNPDSRDPSSIQKYYKPLNISSSSYFNNTLSTARFKSYRFWQTFAGPSQPGNHWDRSSLSPNAYYSREHNEIVIPAGLMQEPAFYTPDLPSYLTYGAFGAIAGHELSHAFDATGRHYDYRGNYTEWWDAESISVFQSRTRCLIEQYNSFSIFQSYKDAASSPLYVNGTLTLDENLADTQGLKLAFLAWQSHEASHGPSQLLPGLENFTPTQLFFLSYSRFWCEKSRTENLKQRLKSDPYAPGFARIRGAAVENSEEFQLAFGCAREEGPRCKMW
ncbi:MAG: hypothetical protein M1818_001041 [Claussenomyces sp. TS43310]|nr:MAG: hypothetical protein M1818_001041 [Claussenomyces sp. TS43310]